MSLDIDLTTIVDTGGPELHRVALFSANYTHNVVPMWSMAECYNALYESDGQTAADILPALEEGIRRMELCPEAFRALDPPNGWGSYDTALPFLRSVRDACWAHPKARVNVSR